MINNRDHRTPTRRTILRIGAILASVSALWPSLALAESHSDKDDDRDNGERGFPANFGRGLGRGLFQNNFSSMMLVSVGSVNGGTGGGDFGANNPGNDGIGRSGVLVSNTAGRQVGISLSGVLANTGYDVQFERLNDHGREDLGSITTDGNGNFSGLTPNALGGTNRVGTIVLIRNGQDEYVTSWA